MSTSTRRTFYRTGQIREEVPLRNGGRHGLCRSWHRSGVLASEERYDSDRLHGVCRQWDENGRLLGQYRMNHGTGIQRAWYDNGVLQWEHSLVNGKATGPSRRWLQDGSLVAEKWLVENREVTPAQYAKAAHAKLDWPRFKRFARSSREVSARQIEKRAFQLHCQWLLGKRNTRDAVAWLEETGSEARAVGRLSGRRARTLVAAALAAGARRVLGADIYCSKRGKEFADVLLIKLPKAKNRRAAVRAVFASLPRRAHCAIQPDRDRGEDWLYVYFG